MRVIDAIPSADEQPTIGVDLKTYRVELGGKIVKAQIWDTVCTLID